MNELYRNTRNEISNTQRSNVQIISKVERLHRFGSCKMQIMWRCCYLSNVEPSEIESAFVLRVRGIDRQWDPVSKRIVEKMTSNQVPFENMHTANWLHANNVHGFRTWLQTIQLILKRFSLSLSLTHTHIQSPWPNSDYIKSVNSNDYTIPSLSLCLRTLYSIFWQREQSSLD